MIKDSLIQMQPSSECKKKSEIEIWLALSYTIWDHGVHWRLGTFLRSRPLWCHWHNGVHTEDVDVIRENQEENCSGDYTFVSPHCLLN